MTPDRTGEVWARSWDGHAYSYDGESIEHGETYDVLVVVGPPVERDGWNEDDEMVHPCVHIFEAFATHDPGEIARIAETRLQEPCALRLR